MSTPASIPSFMAGTVLILAGCGGDSTVAGGGSDPVELLEITSVNAKTVAGATLMSSLEGGSLGSFAMSGTSGVGVTTSSKTTSYYSKVGLIQGAEATSLLKQSGAGYMEAAIGPQVEPCELGGSVTLSGDIANAQTLTPGDSITLHFTACDDGVSVVDGTLSMTITSFSGDFEAGFFSFGVTLELDAFEVVEDGELVAADGDLALTVDAASSSVVTVTIAASSLEVSGPDASHALTGYALTQIVDGVTADYSIEASGTLTSSVFEGAVVFETVEPFVGSGSGGPSSGELLITGANGATIRVIVLDTMFVRLEIDTSGDGTPEEIVDATWDELT